MNEFSFQKYDFKLNAILEKANKERVSTLNQIIHNRKINIFKQNKSEQFMQYEDWKKTVGNNHKSINQLTSSIWRRPLENQISKYARKLNSSLAKSYKEQRY